MAGDQGSVTCWLDELRAGNAAADLNAALRKGDNLYTDSVIALDPDSGKMKWYYQEIPQDVWDFDASYEMHLVDLPVQLGASLVGTDAKATWYLSRASAIVATG